MSRKKLSEQAVIERVSITGLDAGKWNATLNVLFYLCDALDMKPDEFACEVGAEREELEGGRR